jgi:hypothetical protein
MSAADGRLHAATTSEGGGRECNSLHPDHFWKAGRYKLAAPVSKTGSAQTRGRSITDAFRHFGHVPTLNRNPQRKETYATRYPLPKPIALSQELQTRSSYPNPTGEVEF